MQRLLYSCYKETISFIIYIDIILRIIKVRYYRKNKKKRLYKVLSIPEIVYACETWPSSKENKKKQTILKIKFFKHIFGSKENDERGEYEIKTYNKIKGLLGEYDVI